MSPDLGTSCALRSRELQDRRFSLLRLSMPATTPMAPASGATDSRSTVSMGSGGCTSARRAPLGDDANPPVAAAVFAVEEKREISPPLSP
jgi:hypothetical protein